MSFPKSLLITTLTITTLGVAVLGVSMMSGSGQQEVQFTTQQTFTVNGAGYLIGIGQIVCGGIDSTSCKTKITENCFTVTVTNQYRTENEIRDRCKTFTIPQATRNKTTDGSPERDRILEAKGYKPSLGWIVDYGLSCNEHLIEGVEVTASKCKVGDKRTVTIGNGENDIKDFDFKLYLKSIGHKLSTNPAILNSCDHKFRQICTDTGKKDSSGEKLGRRIRDHGHNGGVHLYEYFRDPNGNGCYPEDLNNTVVECIPKKIPGYSQRTKDTKMDCDESIKGPASNNCGYKLMYPDRDGDGYGDKNHEGILSCPQRTKDTHGNLTGGHAWVDNKKDVCDTTKDITTQAKYKKFYADKDNDNYPDLGTTYEGYCPNDVTMNRMLPRADNTRDCNDNDKKVILGCKTCDANKDPSCPVACGDYMIESKTSARDGITSYHYYYDTPICKKGDVQNIKQSTTKRLWECHSDGSLFTKQCGGDKSEKTLPVYSCKDGRNENKKCYDYDCDGICKNEDCNDCDNRNQEITSCSAYEEIFGKSSPITSILPWFEFDDKFLKIMSNEDEFRSFVKEDFYYDNSLISITIGTILTADNVMDKTTRLSPDIIKSLLKGKANRDYHEQKNIAIALGNIETDIIVNSVSQIPKIEADFIKKYHLTGKYITKQQEHIANGMNSMTQDEYYQQFKSDFLIIMNQIDGYGGGIGKIGELFYGLFGRLIDLGSLESAYKDKTIGQVLLGGSISENKAGGGTTNFQAPLELTIFSNIYQNGGLSFNSELQYKLDTLLKNNYKISELNQFMQAYNALQKYTNTLYNQLLSQLNSQTKISDVISFIKNDEQYKTLVQTTNDQIDNVIKIYQEYMSFCQE